MNIKPLRRYSNPDLSDFVVHFTGRYGSSSPEVPPEITNREPWDRLAQILMMFTIRAFAPFGSSEAVVCFTECTRAGIQALMAERRYAPCGLAFSKDTVFRSGGGPALYVRGDEWPDVDQLPPRIRARVTRFWPGADEPSREAHLPWYLERPSEWAHEREWRVGGTRNPLGFRFQWQDVAFVIAPDPRWQSFVASYIGGSLMSCTSGRSWGSRLLSWLPMEV